MFVVHAIKCESAPSMCKSQHDSRYSNKIEVDALLAMKSHGTRVKADASAHADARKGQIRTPADHVRPCRDYSSRSIGFSALRH